MVEGMHKIYFKNDCKKLVPRMTVKIDIIYAHFVVKGMPAFSCKKLGKRGSACCIRGYHVCAGTCNTALSTRGNVAIQMR